jgi:uncharacterized membrane protein HdeD (DUF308 family)
MATTTLDDIHPEREASRLASIWWAPMLLGAELLITGVLALFARPIAGLAAMVMLGVLLVIAGGAEIVAPFRGARHRRVWLTALAGVLSVAAGVAVIAYPASSLAASTLVLGAFFVVAGLFRIITSVLDRYAHWGWDLAYGVLAASLGAWVLSTWPISSLWVIGTVVGVELIFRGVAWLGIGAAMRRAEKRDISDRADLYPSGTAAR